MFLCFTFLLMGHNRNNILKFVHSFRKHPVWIIRAHKVICLFSKGPVQPIYLKTRLNVSGARRPNSS